MAANNLVNTKAELISGMVQKELTESVALFNFMTDYSSLATKGYNSVSIPKMSQFTVANRTLGQKGTEAAPLTDAKDTINIDKFPYVLWGYDDADAQQSAIEYQVESAKRATTAHVRQFNLDIVALWENIAGLSLNAGVPADITAADILAMRQYLIDNFADMNNVDLLIGSDMEAVMLALPEFSQYDYRGNGASPIVNGVIGTVYGIRVHVLPTSIIGTQQAFMIEKSGSGFAFGKAAKYAEESDIEYGSDGKKAIVDASWGLGGLQVGEGSAAAGKSPFVVALRD